LPSDPQPIQPEDSLPASPFPLLASPIRLAGLEIPNRTVMSAMSSGLGTEDGRVTPAIEAYYRARAVGGTGLIVVEFTCVDRRFGRAETRQIALDRDEAVAGHRDLVRIIRENGARAAIQLHAPGQHADRRTVEGLPAGPSAEFSRRDGATPLCRALEQDEIVALVEAYGRAAERAVAAGYEAIEIHGAHGYLPMAFLSPAKNRRDDGWGGDEERRLRFPAAIIRAVKAALGPDRPLIYRLSSSDFLPGGLGLDDMVRVAPRLVEAGADAIHVSSGSIDGSLDRTIDPMSAPEGWRLAHCRAIREAARVPVIGVGPIRRPEAAEAGLVRGDIDMVALGRSLLADPDWPRKAIGGRAGSIRPCTNCNWCFDRVVRHHPIGCAENPATGAESLVRLLVGGSGRRAIVVGGGPGGMTAALDLAAAGFRTELYERRPQVGGGLIASATPPLKDKIFWYLDYLRARLAESPVAVHAGTAIDAQAILASAPDAVVLATGAAPLDFPIPGAGPGTLVDAYALLMGEATLPPPGSAPAMVYGGGETGCETAEYLAARGYKVILVTRSPLRDLARSAEPMYRKQLKSRLQANPAIVIRAESTVVALADGRVRLRDAAGECEIEAACLVLAQGRKTGTPLQEGLAGAPFPVVAIGDVAAIGRIGDAVHAARRAVLDLLVPAAEAS
jgi:2,4-dienoyl-CoA reductase-like NADH-dependent reductase (Old Yellow Enzyme family)